MRELLLVAKEEYRKRAAKRSFVITTLLIPFIYVIIFSVAILVAVGGASKDPFGYVDLSGTLPTTISPATDDSVEMRPFPDEASARIALENGEIQGYHIIPTDYPQNLEVELVYLEDRPKSEILVDFDNFVRDAILVDAPDPVQNRIIDGSEVVVRSIDGRREFREGIGFVTILFPFVVTMFFFMAVMGSSGYFLQAITDEKENRTMELMITSISPFQLVGGKALGLLSVSLTQISIWLLTTFGGLYASTFLIDEMRGFSMPWDILVLFIVFFIPAYALVGGFMIAIGSMVTELREGQQVSGIINILFISPLFFTGLTIASPDASILKILSFFPTTSFLTILLRWGFTIIPLWQVILSWVILVATSTLVIWIASRIFRLGMLRYGQRLSFKNVLNMFRESPSGAGS